MRTESGMNNMNMDKTNRKARARNMRRRILASVCALAIAMLQCAVIVTVGTEDAHAAGLTIKVKCTGGTGSVDAGDLSGEATIPIPGQEDKKGITLVDLFDNKVGIEKYDSIAGGYGDEYLLEPTEMKVYKPDGTGAKSVSSINYVMKDTYTPVTGITIDGDVTVEVDKSVNVSYTVEGEPFFADNKGKYDDYVEWNSSNNDIATVSNGKVTGEKKGTATITLSSKVGGISKSITATVKEKPKDTDMRNATVTGVKNKVYNGKAQTQSDFKVVLDGVTLKKTDYTVKYKDNTKVGTATMTLTGKGKYKNSKKVTFKITEKPKPPKPSSEASKSLNNATITKTGKIYKGKKYKKSTIKERISVSVNGKTIDKKYWDVADVSYSSSGYTMSVTIKGKNGYSGGTTSTVSASYEPNNNNNNRPTYRTYTPRTTRSGAATTSTGTTAPIQTYAPDRTITVKEVFLGQEVQDEPVEQPTPQEMMEEGWDEMSEEPSDDFAQEEDFQLDFGPMAGSAAVAVAACGAGAVGRIRRFKLDTAAEAVKSVKGIFKRG